MEVYKSATRSRHGSRIHEVRSRDGRYEKRQPKPPITTGQFFTSDDLLRRPRNPVFHRSNVGIKTLRNKPSAPALSARKIPECRFLTRTLSFRYKHRSADTGIVTICNVGHRKNFSPYFRLRPEATAMNDPIRTGRDTTAGIGKKNLFPIGTNAKTSGTRRRFPVPQTNGTEDDRAGNRTGDRIRSLTPRSYGRRYGSTPDCVGYRKRRRSTWVPVAVPVVRCRRAPP